MALSLNLGLRVSGPVHGAPRALGVDLRFSVQRYAAAGPFRSTLPPGFTFSRTGAGTALRD